MQTVVNYFSRQFGSFSQKRTQSYHVTYQCAPKYLPSEFESLLHRKSLHTHKKIKNHIYFMKQVTDDHIRLLWEQKSVKVR